MTTEIRPLSEIFLRLPRRVLGLFYHIQRSILVGDRENLALLPELIALLRDDLKTQHLFRQPPAELSDAIAELEKALESSKPSTFELAQKLEALLLLISHNTQPDRRVKEANSRSHQAQECADFCVKALLERTAQLDEQQRAQFRRQQRITYCKQLALNMGREDLAASMSDTLFTERVIPAVTRLLKAKGLYIRPRRPHKPPASIDA